MTKKRARVSESKGRAAQLSEERTAGLAEEYRYVTADLKRIAVLAAGMFALLIVLAFVLV